MARTLIVAEPRGADALLGLQHRLLYVDPSQRCRSCGQFMFAARGCSARYESLCRECGDWLDAAPAMTPVTVSVGAIRMHFNTRGVCALCGASAMLISAIENAPQGWFSFPSACHLCAFPCADFDYVSQELSLPISPRPVHETRDLPLNPTNTPFAPPLSVITE